MRMFYHVTKKSNLEGIKKHGLQPNSLVGKKNFMHLSKPNSIYLSTTAESALEFVADFGKPHVLLIIPEFALKRAKLIKDENFEEFEDHPYFRVENIIITDFLVANVDMNKTRANYQ